ncbi:DUF5983 family protein [Erwinia sp. JH02]|uniref:DUF5983 family protein n=1 Tax=Erwinia sp. JH02 TaxID=2733394 RepID=UPI001489ADA3|nr:hypothetical protein [Erwinia sp. JH02]
MKREIRKMLICSTGNITREDSEVFREQCRVLAGNSEGRWVVGIFYGFIVRPDVIPVPAMTLRNAGVSENTIRLLTEGCETYGVDSFCFDCDGDPLEGWPFETW